MAIPFAPRAVYDPSSDRTSAILLRQGENAADAAHRSGQIWGGLTQNLGGIASGLLQDHQEAKQQQALSKRDAAFMQAVADNDGNVDLKLAGRFYNPRDAVVIAKSFAELQQAKAKPGAEALSRLPGIAQGYLRVSPAVRKIVYENELRPTALQSGYKPEQLPEQWDENVDAFISDIAKRYVPPKEDVITKVGPSEVVLKNGEPIFTAPSAVKPDTRSIELQMADALAKGDQATYDRLLRVQRDAGRAGRAPEKTDPSAQFMPGQPMAQLSGEDYLKTLDPKVAGEVKAYAEGRRPFPSGMALKTPYFQGLIQAVGQYDPTFDAANYQSRSKTRNDFTSGKSAQTLNALNTVIGHMDRLSTKVDELNNFDTGIVNSVKNWGKSAVGSPAVNNFETVKKGVVDELTKLWRQSGGNQADIESKEAVLKSSGSPAQLNGAIGEFAEMIESKIQSLEEQKRQGMGEAGRDIETMTKNARKSLDRLKEKAAGISGGSGKKDSLGIR